MKITYDDQAENSYIYFTEIGPGGVADTMTYQEITVALDSNDQIVSLKILESEDCTFEKRLKYVNLHPEVTYLENESALQVVFASDARPTRTIPWDGNLDLDREGQILGLEILFASPDDPPNRGQEPLCAQDKLEHLSKYHVPYKEFFSEGS